MKFQENGPFDGSRSHSGKSFLRIFFYYCVIFQKHFNVSGIPRFSAFSASFWWWPPDSLSLWLPILLCAWGPDMRASAHSCPQAFSFSWLYLQMEPLFTRDRREWQSWDVQRSRWLLIQFWCLVFDAVSKESCDTGALIYLVTAWGFNAFSVSEERASYGGGERSYGKINIFISLGHWQFVAMIRGITAQGELVGQNLMRGTYNSENGHKDLLQESKK